MLEGRHSGISPGQEFVDAAVEMSVNELADDVRLAPGGEIGWQEKDYHGASRHGGRSFHNFEI
jgi:hypothetical protein